jgi:hypothetical protein
VRRPPHPGPLPVGARATAWRPGRGLTAWPRHSPSPSPRRGEGARRADEGVFPSASAARNPTVKRSKQLRRDHLTRVCRSTGRQAVLLTSNPDFVAFVAFCKSPNPRTEGNEGNEEDVADTRTPKVVKCQNNSAGLLSFIAASLYPCLAASPYPCVPVSVSSCVPVSVSFLLPSCRSCETVRWSWEILFSDPGVFGRRWRIGE